MQKRMIYIIIFLLMVAIVLGLIISNQPRHLPPSPTPKPPKECDQINITPVSCILYAASDKNTIAAAIVRISTSVNLSRIAFIISDTNSSIETKRVDVSLMGNSSDISTNFSVNTINLDLQPHLRVIGEINNEFPCYPSNSIPCVFSNQSK